MNRRELFGALLGLGAASAVTAAPVRKYGLLTVKGHLAHRAATGEDLHVWVDGIEVHHCYEADDVEGYALLFCHDRQSHSDWTTRAGAIHVGKDGGACNLRVTGHVVIAPGVTR